MSDSDKRTWHFDIAAPEGHTFRSGIRVAASNHIEAMDLYSMSSLGVKDEAYTIMPYIPNGISQKTEYKINHNGMRFVRVR